MNSLLHGTVEEPGLDQYKVCTLEAPSGGAWFALEAALFQGKFTHGRSIQ
jgi:hypothetical protein